MARLYSEKKNRERGLKPSTEHKYTLADITILISPKSNAECARLLGVSYGAVYQYRKRMGISVISKTVYSEEEEAILREPISNRTCAEVLGVPITAVYTARKHRGITYR